MALTRWLWGRQILCLLCGLLGTAAWAGPRTIHYQGRLLNTNGTPVTFPITITFTFWDALSSGNRLGDGFIDADLVTPDANGYYATDIGDTDVLLIPQEMWKTDLIYLNVNINNENLVPRKKLGDTGFSSSTETVNGGEVGRMRFTAARTVLEGQIVALDDAGFVLPTVLAGAETWATPPIAPIFATGVVGLGPQRVLLANETQALLSRLENGQLVQGTPLELTGEDFGDATFTGLVALDDNHALWMVARGYYGTFTQEVRVLTANGHELTVGPATTVLPLAGDQVLCGLAADKAIVFCAEDSFSAWNYRVLNINGDGVTPGALRTLSGVSGSLGDGGFPVDANRVLIFSDNLLRLVQVDADTATLKFRGRLDKAGVWARVSGGMLTASTGAVRYSRTAGTVCVALFSISGDSVTTQPAAVMTEPISVTPDKTQLGLYPPADVACVNQAGTELTFGHVQGTSITLGNAIPFQWSSVAAGSVPVMLSSDSVLLTYEDQVIAQRLIHREDTPNPVDFSRSIGVAEESAQAGEQCLVTISGGITDQYSGLLPGMRYYVSELGPQLQGDQPIGQAITPTKLQVWR